MKSELQESHGAAKESSVNQLREVCVKNAFTSFQPTVKTMSKGNKFSSYADLFCSS